MDSKFDILEFKLQHYSKRSSQSTIKALIIHAVGIPDISNVFAAFNQYGVSAHYFVPQVTALELLEKMPDVFDGQSIRYPDSVPVIRMVHDEDKAFHAGVSSFRGFNLLPGCEKSLNECTIGIEFHSPGYACGDGSDLYVFGNFTKSQQDTGIALCKYLIDKHQSDALDVFAHSTIAVGRKTDPGPNFFWKELYANGIGYMPEPVEIIVEGNQIQFVQEKLQKIGFTTRTPQGELDKVTHECIDAYLMQFATHLWFGKNNLISADLISSLNGFRICLHK